MLFLSSGYILETIWSRGVGGTFVNVTGAVLCVSLTGVASGCPRETRVLLRLHLDPLHSS